MCPAPIINARGVPYLERLLLFGGEGAGKTRAVLDIAKWAAKRDQTPTFYWMTSDRGVEGFFVPGGQYEQASLLVEDHPVSLIDWDTWLKAIASIGKSVARNPAIKDMEPTEIPWLVIDLAEAAWSAAQSAHIDRVAGQNISDYWLGQAKDTRNESSGWAVFEDMNWTVINRLYAELSNFFINFPGHVALIAGEKPVSKDRQGNMTEQDRNIGAWFGREGYKPNGQKDLAYHGRSVVRMVAPARAGGPWTMSHLKDIEGRVGREEGLDGAWKDFMISYLHKVGWKL